MNRMFMHFVIYFNYKWILIIWKIDDSDIHAPAAITTHSFLLLYIVSFVEVIAALPLKTQKSRLSLVQHWGFILGSSKQQVKIFVLASSYWFMFWNLKTLLNLTKSTEMCRRVEEPHSKCGCGPAASAVICQVQSHVPECAF